MQEIFIDFISRKFKGTEIVATQGDNTNRKIKIKLMNGLQKYDLSGKTVQIAIKKISPNPYVSKGDFFNLNITNAQMGEVELTIDKRFTREVGRYELQLTVLNGDNFEENSIIFGATIERKIGDEVVGELVESIVFQELKSALQRVKDIEKNEQSRIEAEQSRVKAEEQREKTINEFKPQVIKNTKEIERIYEQLNANSFISQEGEYITVQHSKVGFTKEMRLYGKTLYKKKDGTYTDAWEEGCALESCGEAEQNKISYKSNGKNLINQKLWGDTEIVDGIQCLVGAGWKTDESTAGNPIILPLNTVIKNGTYYLFSKNKATNFFNKFILLNSKTLEQEIITQNNTKGSFVITQAEVKITNKNYDAILIDTGEGSSKAYLENIYLSSVKPNDFEVYIEDKKEIQLTQEFKGLKNKQDIIEKTNEGIVLIQNVGERPYRIGDETSPDVMTDKLKTYYILDRPIKTMLKEITTLNLQTFEELTHISSFNVISPKFNLKAPANLPAIISDLNSSNTVLVAENHKLKYTNKKQNEALKNISDTTDFLIEDALTRRVK